MIVVKIIVFQFVCYVFSKLMLKEYEFVIMLIGKIDIR